MEENQKEIMEGEVIKKFEAEFDEKAAKKKRVLMLLVVGVLIGLFLKGVVLKPYVIGFEDYKLKNYKSDFNLQEETEEVVNNGENTENQETENTETIDPATAPSCGE